MSIAEIIARIESKLGAFQGLEGAVASTEVEQWDVVRLAAGNVYRVPWTAANGVVWSGGAEGETIQVGRFDGAPGSQAQWVVIRDYKIDLKAAFVAAGIDAPCWTNLQAGGAVWPEMQRVVDYLRRVTQ